MNEGREGEGRQYKVLSEFIKGYIDDGLGADMHAGQ